MFSDFSFLLSGYYYIGNTIYFTGFSHKFMCFHISFMHFPSFVNYVSEFKKERVINCSLYLVVFLAECLYIIQINPLFFGIPTCCAEIAINLWRSDVFFSISSTSFSPSLIVHSVFLLYWLRKIYTLFFIKEFLIFLTGYFFKYYLFIPFIFSRSSK